MKRNDEIEVNLMNRDSKLIIKTPNEVRAKPFIALFDKFLIL